MKYLSNLAKSLIPEKIKLKLKTYLLKTGSGEVPYSLYGALFLLTLLITVIIYAIVLFPSLSTSNPIFLIIGSFISLTAVEFIMLGLIVLSLWILYEFIIFKRISEIERVLPDFLQEVSVNLRAGMSFDKSLWNSIEPEFGVLEKEIEIVSKKVMTGKDTEKALKEFSEKYNSTLIQESMDMIIVGLRSGGDISGLIDKIVDNVKEAYYLRRELIASIMSYVIFISITAIVISPTLFALSFNLMQIIQSMGENLSSSVSYGVTAFNIGFKSINPEDFILYSKISVIIISAISSMIIADLREGSLKAGIKYLFIYIPSSYVVYNVMLFMFTRIFNVII